MKTAKFGFHFTLYNFRVRLTLNNRTFLFCEVSKGKSSTPKSQRFTRKPAEQRRYPTNLEDAQYIGRVLAGDVAAFEFLVERYSSPVYNFCCRMLNNRAEGEDADQEVVIRAFTQLSN